MSIDERCSHITAYFIGSQINKFGPPIELANCLGCDTTIQIKPEVYEKIEGIYITRVARKSVGSSQVFQRCDVYRKRGYKPMVMKR